MNEPSAAELFPVSPESYGPLHQPTLVDQYHRYVESAERVSERRSSANNYLLTVNTALVSIAGLTETIPLPDQWIPPLPIAGMLVCLTWLGLLASYRDLNAAKFAVIQAIERRLPAAVYSAEWSQMRSRHASSFGPLSRLEGGVPFAFLVVYLALAVMPFVR